MARTTTFEPLTPEQRAKLPYSDALGYEMMYAVTGDSKRLIVRKPSRHHRLSPSVVSAQNLVERDRK